MINLRYLLKKWMRFGNVILSETNKAQNLNTIGFFS